MDIQLFSIAEHPPEGFTTLKTAIDELPSTNIILYADSVETALEFLNDTVSDPGGLILTTGDSFNSSPASSRFWHLAIPESDFPEAKNIAECFLDIFGTENIQQADSYELLQNRISRLLLESVKSRRTENSLRKQEAELKQVHALARIGSWKWNLQTGFVTLSTELCRIYSISESEDYPDIFDLIDRFTHPDDIEEVSKAVKQASLNQKSKPLTFRILRPDGEIRWLKSPEPEIVKVDDNNKPLEIIGIQQDITEQVKAVDELRQSELKLGEAARNIPGAIFQFYIRKTGEFGIDFVGGNLEKIFGLPEDSNNLFESFVSGITSKKHKDDFYSSIDKAVRTAGDWNFEIPFRKPSGELIYIRGTSKPTLLSDVLFFNGVMLDVTEQRNAIQHIEHLNSLLLAIRNVNQLIVQETSLKNLLQKSCDTLIETRSYQDCTVVLLDDDEKIGDIYQAGENSYSREELNSVQLPACIARSIETGKYVVMENADECSGCIFLGKHGDSFHPTFVAPMKSDDRNLGILFVSISNETVFDTDEASLLQEVTNDLAYAMQKLNSEAKLIKSETRYRKLFDSSRDAIMTLDPPSWKFTSGNPSILGMFGVSSEEEFTSLGPWDVSPEYQPDGQLSSEKAKKMINIAMEEGSNFFEWTHRSVSGKDFPATVLLTRVTMRDTTFLQATVRDISARKEMEEALRKSEVQLRNIADSIPGVIYQFYSRPDGKTGFYYVSERTSEVLGIPSGPEEFFDRFIECIPLENLRSFMNSMQQATRTTSVWEYTTAFIKPSGNQIRIKSMSIPTKFENETVFNGVILDITKQWEAEEALRAERDYTASIISGTPALICGISPEGITRYINPAVEAAMGYSSSEIVGRNWWKVFFPDKEYLQVERLFRKLSEEGNINDFEMTLTARDGERRVISWNSINRLDENNSISEIVGFGFDITERRKAEADLQKSEQLFRSVVENAPAGIFLMDSDFLITYSNEQLSRLSGYSINELAGLDFRDILDEASRKTVMDRFGQRQKSKETNKHFELGIIRKDGVKRQIIVYVDYITDAEGNVSTLGEIIDITEQKTIEHELNQLRNYMANIIDSMPSVLIGVSKTGRVTLWNSGAEARTGLSSREAFGKALDEVIPRMKEYLPAISESISSREVKYMAKQNASTGEEIRFEDLTVYPLVADDVEGAVIRIDDVTKQVHIEEMMIQSEKMLSVGGLAAGMAHEINNPLAGMMQNAEVILKRLGSDLPDNDRVAEEVGTTMEAIRSFLEKRSILHQLELIHDSGKRAAVVVQNMLSFARKSEAKPSRYDVSEILDQTLELAQNDYDLKKNYDFRYIEIKKEYEQSLPKILCERSKIQQVFLNILRNGTEAMWKSKSSTGKPEKPRFILKITAENGYVVTEIEDNGPGIPKSIRKRVFEPFFTTKEVGVGTGLGLSVSYFIITEDHGGKLEIESTPGIRTKFIIKLPVNSGNEE